MDAITKLAECVLTPLRALMVFGLCVVAGALCRPAQVLTPLRALMVFGRIRYPEGSRCRRLRVLTPLRALMVFGLQSKDGPLHRDDVLTPLRALMVFGHSKSLRRYFHTPEGVLTPLRALMVFGPICTSHRLNKLVTLS